MRIATPRERQDHDTTLVYAAALALLLTTLPWHAATAQTAVPCTVIENDAERLACYDRALRGAPPAPAEQPASPAPAARTVPQRAAAPAAAPSSTATVAPAAAPSAAAAAEPSRARRVRESSAPAAPAAPVAGGSGDEVIVPLVIVGVQALPGRDIIFTTDDGSRWVQTDGQRAMALPDPPFDAELKSGAMGSYFLVPKGRTRAIRVRAAR